MKLNYLIVSFFWWGLIMPVSGRCSSLIDNTQELEKAFSNPKKAFMKANESDDFSSIFASTLKKSEFPQKHFSELSQEEYDQFKDSLGLFKGTALKKQVFDLLLFARLAGCPVLAVGEKKEFFYDARQIYDPTEKSIAEGKQVVIRPHQGNFVTIEAVGDEKDTSRAREITSDLRENAVIYHYLGDETNAFDGKKYEEKRKDHYSNHSAAKISYDFLEDYIISPYTLGSIYMSRIILGLKKLPKAAVNMMRGKAIYISSQEGNSGCLYMTSHNIPIISYLGLVPGIFIENNNVTDQNVILMSGALIERSAFRRSVVLQDLHLNSIDFPYFFSGLEGSIKTLDEGTLFFHAFKKYVFQEKGLDPKQKAALEDLCKLDISKIATGDSFPREVIVKKSSVNSK
ncbi:MAG: hypothetical protein J0H12_07400 [Candidatus Paracaedimonas acanthamoebae]|uniref:Uncharacterized protein n=1 Tax=Candidatus Paracaedimonas acanthamoebae TaxID=244581 RepID=A0A8J7PTQ3_9PROT|nr:hypothetical protein [Candidatus Paracaedimonas acanthamoebae]